MSCGRKNSENAEEEKDGTEGTAKMIQELKYF